MIRSKPIRRPFLLGLLALGCAVAAPGFAHDRVSVRVGVALPGVSIGYSDYHGYHHRHRGYWRGGYWVPAYAPVYYRPAPRVVYEEPVVIERPVLVRRVYESHAVYRHGERRWHARDDDDRHGYRRHDRRDRDDRDWDD